MKKANFLLTAVAVLSLWIINMNSTTAQTNANHLFHVNTWYMVPGLDSVAQAEKDATLKEYFEKVDKKNQYIVHQWSMQHYYTDDSREYVTVSEYATWADIDKANERSGELEKQAWPDAQKRKEFIKKMNSFFTTHKDAIYHGLPNLVK